MAITASCSLLVKSIRLVFCQPWTARQNPRADHSSALGSWRRNELMLYELLLHLPGETSMSKSFSTGHTDIDSFLLQMLLALAYSYAATL